MPANPKFLTKNPWHRFAKFISGFLGGYIIAALLHMIFVILFPFHKEALITMAVTMYLVWAIFMIVPYLFKNGWKALIFYLLSILILGTIYYFIQPYNPFIHE